LHINIKYKINYSYLTASIVGILTALLAGYNPVKNDRRVVTNITISAVTNGKEVITINSTPRDEDKRYTTSDTRYPPTIPNSIPKIPPNKPINMDSVIKRN
jgi:hypothetical protein